MVGTVPACGVVLALSRVSDRLVTYGHGSQHLRTSGVKCLTNRQNSPKHLVIVRGSVEIGVADHGRVCEGGHLVGGLYAVAHNGARARHRLRQPGVDASGLTFETTIETAQRVVLQVIDRLDAGIGQVRFGEAMHPFNDPAATLIHWPIAIRAA